MAFFNSIIFNKEGKIAIAETREDKIINRIKFIYPYPNEIKKELEEFAEDFGEIGIDKNLEKLLGLQ